MTSKEHILSKIREANGVPSVSLPKYDNFGTVYKDIFEQFSTTLKSGGGEAVQTTIENLDSVITSLYPDVKVISSNVDGCSLATLDTNMLKSPHELNHVDLAIVKGEFAVAENAAVWVQNRENRHKVLYFIAQSLVIVVKKSELIDNMHQAYERISFENSSYGVFISGASKTADIEQSLVIGAHGPKECHVIFLDE